MTATIKKQTKGPALRKAWSLLEMFYIMFLLAVLLLLMARPTRTIIHRIPHIQADIQTNRILLSVLDSIRKDVATATGIEVAVTEIPAEIKKQPQPPLIDTGIDPNTVPIPAEPNEPTEPMEIELSVSDASYYSTDVFSDSNSIDIPNDPNIVEVVNDANLLVMPADVNNVHNIEMLAIPVEANDVDVEPINTMTSLVIKTDTLMIRYEFANGIAKRITIPDELDRNDPPNIWHIPKARLDMQIWKENEKPYALEIATAIIRRIEGRTRDTMSNSHVFFVKEQSR